MVRLSAGNWMVQVTQNRTVNLYLPTLSLRSVRGQTRSESHGHDASIQTSQVAGRVTHRLVRIGGNRLRDQQLLHSASNRSRPEKLD
jgi:hypothetical protein